MRNKSEIRYGGLYLATLTFAAGLVLAGAVHASEFLRRLLDVATLIVGFGLLVVWMNENAAALQENRMKGWRHRPLGLDPEQASGDEDTHDELISHYTARERLSERAEQKPELSFDGLMDRLAEKKSR